MRIVRLAIQRPVLMLMLMTAAVLLGVIGFNSMRVEENPDVDFGVVTIVTIYPGAGPEEVATLVTREIEAGVSGVEGLQELTSSSQEGFSTVVLQFEVERDINEALNDVRTAVDGAIGALPSDAERPIIQKFDSGSEPIMFLGIVSDSLSNRQIRDLADDRLVDRLSRVPGVAGVAVTGGDQREIQVRLRREDLLRFGIGIIDVQSALAQAALNIPAGRAVDGTEEFAVRVLGDFQSVQEIEDFVLTIQSGEPGGPSRGIRLGDIADVRDTNRERRVESRLNRSDSVVMTIQKTREGNAVEISNALLEDAFGQPGLLRQLEREFDIQFIVTRDAGPRIQDSINDLIFALVFGIALVALTIYVFLHNVRGMLIILIAIPLCLMITFFVIWLFGFTINNLTLLAMSLAIGVLVDDSIVAIENIYRHLQMGEEPVEAVINGRTEIGLAAVAVSLADVVVFLPIAFLPGVLGQFFQPLAVAYIVAVLSSLAVGFTITPMLASRWYRKGEDFENPKGAFARRFEIGFSRLVSGYSKAIYWALNHRWFVFCLSLVTLFSVFIFIGGSFAPNFGAAIGAGIPLVFVALVIAMFAFSVNFLRAYDRPAAGRTIVLGAIVVSIVLAIGASLFSPAVPAIPLAIGLSVLLLFLITFAMNLGMQLTRSRILVSALMLGLLFPIAGVIGYQYREYKGEDVFKFSFFPPSDQGQVSINIETAPGTSIAETGRVVRQVEDLIADHPMVRYITSNIGTVGGGFAGSDSGSNLARINVTLLEPASFLDRINFINPSNEPMRPASERDTKVAADMIEMVGRIPGAQITISAATGFGFGRPIQMSFSSDDREALVATTTAIRELLASGEISGVISPEVSSSPGRPELVAVPDRQRLGDLGVSVAEVGGAMRVLFEGDDTAKYRVGGREFDVRVMLDFEDRNDVSNLENTPVTFRNGTPIYLSQISQIRREQSVDKIDRRNRIEEITVSADLLPGFATGSVQAQINQLMIERELVPENVNYRPVGEADVQSREQGPLFLALGLSLILVYMLLASLYENLLYPFVVQLAQPQAFVGALLALMIFDKTLNIVGFIGLIVLAGVVGKNAIILVDYTNTLRKRGMERFEAQIEASKTRLRPILMTSLTLVGAMIPIAAAIGRGSEFRETIGFIIIGGISLSTLLTLFVVPCSYSIFDDLSELLSRGKKHMESPGEGEALTEAQTKTHEETPR